MSKHETATGEGGSGAPGQGTGGQAGGGTPSEGTGRQECPPHSDVCPPHSDEGLAHSDDHAQRQMIRSAGVVGIMTILSRVLGLVRFRLMAHFFGATGVADAFNFAFIFPNLTRRLFGEGLLTSAFVPVFSDRLAKDQKHAANKTASVLLLRLAYWLSLGCVVFILLAAGARAVLPGMLNIPPDHHLLLQIKLFQWMLPYCVFINVAAVLMAILNSMGHFVMPAFAPVLLNVAMIAACLFALPYFGTLPSEQIWAVAYAVLIGGLLQVVIQLPPALTRGFKFSMSADKTDPGYQEVMENFKPVMLLMAVFQINVLLDSIIAQVFIPETGPVTYLNMGTSVYQLPWSIFSLALGTAALPALARFWALKQTDKFRSTLFSALRLCIFLAIPCTIGIMILSDDIVLLLYGSGHFLDNDGEAVRRTAGVVRYSSLGLVFFSVNALLARALYASKDMITPTRTSAWSVAINIVLNLLFVAVLPMIIKGLTPPASPSAAWNFVQGLGNMKESGIALASTISTAWQTWMLARAVNATSGAPASSGKIMTHGRFIAALTALMAACAVSGVIAHQMAAAKKEWEGFVPFFAAAVFALGPFIMAGRTYFINVLENVPKEKEGEHRFGVSDANWPEPLVFQFAIYNAIVCSAVMGFIVWAVQSSLPPEGRTFVLVAQRAVFPVIAGIMAFSTVASGLMAREYDELQHAWNAKFRKRGETKA